MTELQPLLVEPVPVSTPAAANSIPDEDATPAAKKVCVGALTE